VQHCHSSSPTITFDSSIESGGFNYLNLAEIKATSSACLFIEGKTSVMIESSKVFYPQPMQFPE
jgi:hypothetical protein